MAAKKDLSRLVMLTYTPSEAVVLKTVLTVVLARWADKPFEANVVLADSIERIDLQLRDLKWPERVVSLHGTL